MLVDLNRGRLLITGGAGFMGSAFIRMILENKGFEGHLFNLDALTYCGNLDNLQLIQEDKRYTFVEGNITNKSLLKTLVAKEKIEAIVHFAAETHVDRSIEDGAAFVKTNVLGTYFLLEIVREFPHIHFHHVSTDEVYGSLGKEGFFTEESPYLPNSPYSASKAASDHFVRAFYKTYQLSITLSHAGNNYGPYQYPEKLIPFMITKLLKNEPLPLYGDGLNVRDWLYVDDHARALCAILTRGERGEIYNIASSEEYTNRSLIQKMISCFCKQRGQNPAEHRVLFVKDRLGHDFRYAMDASKLMKKTGWEPQITFDQGLETTIKWYLENSAWLHRLEKRNEAKISVSV